MNAETTQSKNTNRDEYDSPWKEGIEKYFKEFMEFYFPQIASEIDWDKGYEFLDKELQGIVRDAKISRRHADKLIKVCSCKGEEFYVLIHVEIQSDKDIQFSKRMYIYNYRFFDKYYLPVTSIAILADQDTTWRPNSYSSEQWGCKINFQFPMVKLIDYNDKIDDLLQQTNPFAIITAAHLKTKATKGDPQTRYLWKLTITKALYKKGFSEQDIMNLYRLIDWLMFLPEELSKNFTKDLIIYEEERKMPYITTAERVGIKKGMEQGMEQGMLLEAKEMVLEVLDLKFNSKVPSNIHKTIMEANNRIILKRLHGSAVQSKDVDGFKKIFHELSPELMQ